MTAHDLKIWLVTHGYTQKTLAEALGVTEKTVNTWANNRPPQWLGFALAGLLQQVENEAFENAPIEPMNANSMLFNR